MKRKQKINFLIRHLCKYPLLFSECYPCFNVNLLKCMQKYENQFVKSCILNEILRPLCFKLAGTLHTDPTQTSHFAPVLHLRKFKHYLDMHSTTSLQMNVVFWSLHCFIRIPVKLRNVFFPFAMLFDF